MKRFDTKRQFPVFRNQHYFNFGSSGPMAMAAVERMHAHLLHGAKEGPSSPGFMQEYLSEYVSLKELLSEFLNVSHEEISITQNTSEGMNIILRGLSWKADDEIITTEFEHPGLRIPLETLKRDYSVRIKNIKIDKLSQASLLREMERNISPKVRMVALSHVDYIIGLRLPIERIAGLLKEYNILLLLDGAQAVGAIPVDLGKLGCDFYSFPSHKWLLGPRGMGCLFIAKRCIGMVNPVFTGWCSVNNIGPKAVVSVNKKIKKDYSCPNFLSNAGKFAVSTWNTSGVAGFLESLSIFRKHLEKKIEERSRDILFFKKELAKIPGVIILTPMHQKDSAGIVSFKFKNRSSFKIVRELIFSNVIVRYLPEIDCIRCCISVSNDKRDLVYFISKLRQIIKR